MRIPCRLIVSVLLSLPWAAIQAQQSATDPVSGEDAETRQLRDEIHAQEERLRELERRLDAHEARQRAAAAGAAPTTPAAAHSASPAPSSAAASGATAAAPVSATSPAAVPASAPGSLPAPVALLGSFDENGLRIRSADAQNTLHLGANLSLDYRYFDDSFDKTSADTWLVRKARVILEGQLGGRYDFRFMPDFGQGKSIIQDAWVAARAFPELIFTVGKFKAPVGLERLQLEQYARFIEASLTADLEPYRDLGATVGGRFGQGLLSYQVGVFDGAPDGGSTDGNSVPDSNTSGKFTWDGRLFSLPFARTGIEELQGLGLGVAATYANVSGSVTATTTNSLLASNKTTGQQSMFSYRSSSATEFNNATLAHGIQRRLVPQAYWYYRSAYLMGEYVRETQQVVRQVNAALQRAATLDHEAWQIQGGFYLTGEHEGYDRSPVDHEVGKGGWGALELVARYHVLHYDRDTFTGGALSFANGTSAVHSAAARGLGLNWYLTRAFRMQLDFEDTHFVGGAASGDRPAERVLTGQWALIF
jgi:phosphate-selective porin OprO and OprP